MACTTIVAAFAPFPAATTRGNTVSTAAAFDFLRWFDVDLIYVLCLVN